MKQLAAVIVAAGHGQVFLDRCKLLEEIDEMTIIERVVMTVKATERFSHIIVVINTVYGSQIKFTLDRAGHTDLLYAHQPDRLGAADCVMRAMPYLEQLGIEDFLVVFGDMPLWKPSTLLDIVEKHKRHGAPMTFLACPYQERHHLSRYMKNYAFLEPDHRYGNLPLLYMYSGVAPEDGDEIISSLYVFNRLWFCEQFHKIPPMQKKDGHADEYHLPHLIPLALLNGYKINKVTRLIPNQILGINNLHDLLVARWIVHQ